MNACDNEDKITSNELFDSSNGFDGSMSWIITPSLTARFFLVGDESLGCLLIVSLNGKSD